MNILNPALVEKQGLTDEQVELLEGLHIAMQSHKNTTIEEIESIPDYITHIRELEYAMQRLWGFDEDANYHTHWYDDPKCSCPKMDNRERSGVNSSVITRDCALHGDLQIKDHNE